jgi:hypothetical protein
VNRLVQELIKPFLDEVDSKYDVVIYGGGFKPPTKGHLRTALKMYQISSNEHQIIIGSGVRDKITSEDSLKIWQLYQNKEGLPQDIKILQASSPVKYALDLAKENPDLKIAFIAGVRDNDDLDNVEKLKKSLTPLGIQVEVIQDDSTEVSGTKVRRAFLSKDKDTFLSLMPQNSGEEIWNILTRSLIPEIQEAQSKIAYRAGLFNPSQPAERLKDKGIGIVKSKVGLLGTGYYFMGNLEDVKRLQDQLGYDVISQIDLSKYNLFRPDDPTGFYENVKAITAYLHGLKSEDLQDSNVKDNIDDAVDAFSSYLNLDKKETYNIFKDYIKDVFKKNDGDLLTNRLLKNYDGIDLTGTRYDDFGVGSLIFNGKLKDETYSELESIEERIYFKPEPNIGLDDVEFLDQYADDKLAPLDIDLKGQHFVDRMNDPRNNPEIEVEELEDFIDKLSDKKDEFIDLLNNSGEIVTKDRQTKLNVPFMKLKNKAIAKTIMRKPNFYTSNPVLNLQEGRYDAEVTTQSRYIINQFKNNLGTDYEEETGGNVDNIEYTLIFKFSPFKDITPVPFIVSGEADYDTLEIKVEYNPNVFPDEYNNLIAELKETLRHELEHIGQFNLDKGVKIEPQEKMSLAQYLVLDAEVPAFIQGLYKRAKTKKIPLQKAIDEFFNERSGELTDVEEADVRKVWDRWIRLNLPQIKLNEGVKDLRPRIDLILKKHNISAEELKAQLKKGTEVEKEHTSNSVTAMKIALDHIAENPKYYDILTKVGLEEEEGKAAPYGSGYKPLEEELKPLILDFTSFLVTNGMKLHPFPKIDFVNNDEENAKDPLGKTAYYNPETKCITLFTLNRHPKDILRSYSHELVHHMQNIENRLKPMNTTNVYEDEELADIEKEAHELGSLNLRKWEDSIKK